MMKKFLTSKEAAEYIGVPETEFQDMVSKGAIPVYKIGGIYTRFKVDDLETYRRKGHGRAFQKEKSNLSDRIKDFFYFNDFYIFSTVVIIVILFFLFN